MKTNVEELSPVKRRLTVDLPVERVVAALEAAYAKVQKTAKLKGFRQGKVPRHLLEQYYREEAERAAMASLVETTYPEASRTANLIPVSRPQIEPGPFAKDRPFTYAATIEVRPTITLGTYTGFHLSKTEFAVTDDEVAAQLQSAQAAMTRLVPTEEGATLTDGMVARIDFEGTADGKSFEGSTAVDHVIEVGGGNLLPLFEEKLRGMTVGEERTIEFTYPDDYFNVTLAGSKAVYHVTLKELKRKEVPELTDDFAKDLGNYDSLDAVRAELRARITAAKERQAKGELGDQAVRQLLEHHPFEVPTSMIGWELHTMYRDLERRAKAEGKELAALGITPEGFAKEYEKIATDRVRGLLILDAIGETEKLTVAEDEIDHRLAEIAQAAQQPVPKVRLYYEQQNLLPGLRREILHEKALDFIIGKSKIKSEKPKKEEKKAK